MFERFKQGTVDVVKVDGPLNTETLDGLRRIVEQIDESGQTSAVLDMRKIPLVDSQALEYVLDLYDSFRSRGGNLKLVGPTPLVAEILNITGVDQFFEVFGDEVSAVGSFTR